MSPDRPEERLPSDATVVVVGASVAGLRACEVLRAGGHEGRILLFDAEQAPLYDRPPLSKELLTGAWPVERLALRSPEKLAGLGLELRAGARVAALDIEQRLVVLEAGDEVAFDGLVVASGAVPKRLPAAIGGDLDAVVVLRTLRDGLTLRSALERDTGSVDSPVAGASGVGRRDGPPGPTRLVIVGAGFLGLEVAASAIALRAKVTVVEPLGAPLERVLGPEVGAALGEVHAERGVEMRLGVGVVGIEAGEQLTGEHAAGEQLTGEHAAGEQLTAEHAAAARVAGERVAGDRGSGTCAGPREREAPVVVVLGDGTRLPADVVLVAIGARPETRWLEGSGLEIDDGVVCDPALGAGPRIVAAGDIARFWHPLAGGLVRIEHWTNAVEQGAHAARTLLAASKERASFVEVPYFWSDQYDLKLQAIGLPGGGDEVVVVEGSLASRRFVACYGRDGHLTGVLGCQMARRLMSYRPLLVRGASFAEALALRT